MMSSVSAGGTASLSVLQRLLGPPTRVKQKKTGLAGFSVNILLLLTSQCCASLQGSNSSISAEAALFSTFLSFLFRLSITAVLTLTNYKKSFDSRLKVYFYFFQSSRPFTKQLRGSFSCAVATFQCILQCLWKSLREIRLIWSLARGADPY